MKIVKYFFPGDPTYILAITKALPNPPTTHEQPARILFLTSSQNVQAFCTGILIL